MNDEKDFPKRKPTRLKEYDYASVGAYFVTICVRERMPILSEIVPTSVGEGLAPPVQPNTPRSVGEGLAPPGYSVRLKPCGEIVKEQLLLIENRYPNVIVKDHIIMPEHIHAIIFINENAGGASPSPTLNDVICAFKSLTTRICRQRCGTARMWQRSYADHIIRDKEDYETRRKYIYDNPIRWYYKHLKDR